MHTPSDKPKSTREQILAQATDRHLAVTANAGSGKTSVLVDRYVRIILDGTDPRSIVAITFTRKAAAEMLARVSKKLGDMLQSATGKELEKIMRVRESLTAARISTIHSFCSQLLREYPIEAGVAPNFSELSESELFRMRRDAIIAVMEDWLEDEGDRALRARAVFRSLGRRNVEEYLHEVLRSGETFSAVQELYREYSDEEILARRNKALAAFILGPANSLLDNLRELVGRIGTQKIRRDQSRFEEGALLLSHWKQNLVPGDLATIEKISQKLVGIIETQKKFCTAEDELLKSLQETAGVSSAELSMNIAYHAKQLKKIFEALIFVREDTQLLEHARTLCDMAAEADAIIEADKAAVSGLDFDDLQMKALKLLQDEEVRKKLRKKISYLMMDEFQDTNQLQYDIARSIVAALEESDTGEASVNIFIVGDAKQSIYGFRSADVRVFQKARRDILSANSRMHSAGRLADRPSLWDEIFGELSEDEKFGDVKLSASFRLLPEIASFVNRVCARSMNSAESDFDVSYEPLVFGESPERMTTGSISVLLAKKYTGAGDEILPEEKISEAEMLAVYLLNCVDSEEPLMVWDKDEKALRPARYGDMAVLARSRAGFDALGEALRARKIPFVIHSGKGFFSTQEVVDLYSYLRFLHNVKDDISLAAVLKSPFFGISDTELFVLSLEKGNSLWEKFSVHCAQQEEPVSKFLRRAYELLTEMIPLAARLPIPILMQTLLERSGWRGAIAGHPRQKQMEANIAKLLQFARDFEDKGFRNLYDFVEELTLLMNSGTIESEAAVVSGENVVNIMTVHASKGLEFPLVAIYNTNAASRGNRSILVSRELGITHQVPAVSEEGVSSVVTPLLCTAQLTQESAERAEEKRLLYVALTRARDHLVLSGTITISAGGTVTKPKGMLQMILEGMDISAADLLFNSTLHFDDPLDKLRNGELVHDRCEYNVQVLTMLEEADIASQELNPEPVLPKLLLAKPDGGIGNEYYSASQIMLFNERVDEFVHRYRLGFPSADDDKQQAGAVSVEGDGDSLVGTLAGTLIHQVLSEIAYWTGEDGKIHEERLDEEIRIAIARTGQPVDTAMRQRIRRETAQCALAPLVQRLRKNFSSAQWEYKLYLPLDNDFLMGVMDTLVQNEEGSWEIWDWKTNRVEGDEDMERLTSYYMLQMQVYAYFLAHLYPKQKEFRARLLFTRLAGPEAADGDWTRVLNWTRREALALGKTLSEKIGEICERSYGLKKKFPDA